MAKRKAPPVPVYVLTIFSEDGVSRPMLFASQKGAMRAAEMTWRADPQSAARRLVWEEEPDAETGEPLPDELVAHPATGPKFRVSYELVQP